MSSQLFLLEGRLECGSLGGLYAVYNSLELNLCIDSSRTRLPSVPATPAGGGPGWWPWEARMDKVAPAERHSYAHEGRTIYEWQQTFR